MGQAERKETPSTLIPDMDNAIVGSQDKITFAEISIRVSPFFVAVLVKRGAVKKTIYRQRGSALCFS